MVSVLRNVRGRDGLKYIIEDSFKGGYLAGEHLIKLGHRRIGIITGNANTSTGINRLEGALGAMRDHGLSIDEKLIMPGSFSKGPAYLAVNY